MGDCVQKSTCKINNQGILKGIITGMAEYIDLGLLDNVGEIERY